MNRELFVKLLELIDLAFHFLKVTVEFIILGVSVLKFVFQGFDLVFESLNLVLGKFIYFLSCMADILGVFQCHFKLYDLIRFGIQLFLLVLNRIQMLDNFFL